MKISCDIINDLLPLYIDDLCSDDSRKLVEEHLCHCEKCKRDLESMQVPIEYPKIEENQKSKDPFLKIRKRVRIKILVAILVTSVLMIAAMISIQEVGKLHDIFYPMAEAVIDQQKEQKTWNKVQVEGNEYLNFSSIFYQKEVVNDANSSGTISIRILDKNGTVVLKETSIKAGESISLKCLHRNENYTVEAKCKKGRFFLNFV